MVCRRQMCFAASQQGIAFTMTVYVRLFALLAALLTVAPVAASPLDDGVLQLEAHWAHANYEVNGKTAQAEALDSVIAEADALALRYPNRAEPLVWRAIAQTAKAGVVRGLAGFNLVKAAKVTLEAATRIDPKAADGLGLSELGTLYYQVPGFPVAFGDRAKAERYLKRALEVAPDSIAVNLAYADFLATSKQPFRAIDVLHFVLKIIPRHDHQVADKGRRAEAEALLAQVQAKRTPVKG